MAILHAYFDAAGHECDQTHVVVSGFISSATDWLDFEKAWTARLQEDGLPYFHAESFRHSTEPFVGWNKDEPRRQRLCRDLMKIVQSHVYRQFGSGVSIANLQRNKASSDVLEKWRINAFVLGGRTCVADIARWIEKEHFEPQVGLIFEDGDLGRGALSDLLHKHGYPRPLFGWPTDRETPLGPQRGLIQLQASDWLAYETFQAAKRLFSNDPRIRHADFRWAWKEFQAIPGIPGFYGPIDLMKLQDNIESYETIRIEIKTEFLTDGVLDEQDANI